MTNIDEIFTLSTDQQWITRGACTDDDHIEDFTGDGGAAGEARARRVCMRCPIRAECLDYALEHDQRFGVWGGLTPAGRLALARLCNLGSSLGPRSIQKV